MSSYTQLWASKDGWSDWKWPGQASHDTHRFACCSCGLVHDIEIAIHKVSPKTADGHVFDATPAPVKTHRIRWRFKVNHRATAQVRRHMQKDAA